MPRNQIGPAVGDVSLVLKSSPKERPRLAWFGFLYIATTLGFSTWYLVLLSPSLANDLYWPGYNASGLQCFLIDAFTIQTQTTTTSATVDLLAIAIEKDYSTLDTRVALQTAYPRRVLAQDLTSIEHGITSLVNAPSISDAIKITTAYCWLDFGHRWPIAHTAAREQRCRARYLDNAAVHMESLLRIVNWHDWLARMGSNFNLAIGTYLHQSVEGAAWLESLPFAYTSLPLEATYWRRCGMQRYVVSWGNLYRAGIDDTISIVNAVGMVQKITIRDIKSTVRGALWTSSLLSWGLWNDLPAVVSSQSYTPNVSLVRNGSANYDTLLPWDAFEGALPSVSLSLFRQHVGPLNAVDTMVVSVAPSLLAYFNRFYTLVTDAMVSNPTFFAAFDAIGSVQVDPVPPDWLQVNRTFLGGSPLCLSDIESLFVQTPFGFDDSCTVATQNWMTVDKWNLLFALTAMAASDVHFTDGFSIPVCGHCPTSSTACASITTKAWAAFDSWNSPGLQDLVHQARADYLSIRVGLIQFAAEHSRPKAATLLTQPLLLAETGVWDFWGWVYLFDWAVGVREVVSFEGDVATFPLVSKAYVDQPYETDGLQVPHSACQYFWYSSVYVTCLLCGVAFVMFGYAGCTRSSTGSRNINLLYFNRVVGSVWVGRPLLFLRGLTAIIILSTSPTQFQTTHGLAKFVFTPRSWIESAVVAGEASWLSYIVHDILLVVTESHAPYYSPISATMSWIIFLGIDIIAPFQMTATLDRTCRNVVTDKLVACSSGRVELGSVSRTIALLLVPVASVCLSYVGVWYVLDDQMTPDGTRLGRILLPGAAHVFLTSTSSKTTILGLTEVESVMCGILHVPQSLQHSMFAIQLWVVQSTAKGLTNESMQSHVEHQTFQRSRHPLHEILQNQGWKTRVLTIFGTAYIVVTLLGSVSYIVMTKVNMANDFWWSSFNSSASHTFLANWFNRNQLLVDQLDVTKLNVPQYADFGAYNVTDTLVQAPAFAANLAALNLRYDLAKTIDGLRRMDACKIPWIATQYCYLDFAQRWAMANSERRQRRCQFKTKNGAIFFESVARNLNWVQFHTCWGHSFDIGFRRYLAQSEAGVQWLHTVEQNIASTSDETTFWKQQGISEFTTQWQNYKSLGIREVFNVMNAFGVTYDLTTKRAVSEFTMDGEITRKLYWTFASDLWAIAPNNTIISGRDLIRNSSNFAFQTDEILETLLILNGTLTNISTPQHVIGYILPNSFSILKNLLGPFGSIDSRQIAAPMLLRQFALNVSVLLRTVLFANESLQTIYSALQSTGTLHPIPVSFSFQNLFTLGGNPFCGFNTPHPIYSALFAFYGKNAPCSSSLSESVSSPTIPSIVFSLLGANFVREDNNSITVAAQQEFTSGVVLKVVLEAVKEFVWANIRHDEIQYLQTRGRDVQNEIYAMNVEIAQYVAWGEFDEYGPYFQSNPWLERVNIFDPIEANFSYFSWGYLYDWVYGNREVVSFEGNKGNFTVISTSSNALKFTPDELEVPQSVIVYFRYAILYVTGVIFTVAMFASVYIVSNNSHIEGLNMFEINRVAGIVWVGRPLLLLRSTAAMCLLSTSILQLEQSKSGLLTYFVSNPPFTFARIVKTILASGEVSWFIYVVNDIFMPITLQYTSMYAFKCNILSWATSALLSFLSPPEHSATLSQNCTFEEVDFDILCNTGMVVIGQKSRFITLITICMVWIILCYGFEKLRAPSLPPAKTIDSPFLCASAKWMFASEAWVYNQAYYMDKASAALNGMLVIQVDSTFFVLDLKTWRRFTIKVALEQRISNESPLAVQLNQALPLRVP
ncbi:Aste57867_16567 [Aphanomyces stellatus]|uniref:Aste57867_16561 protein n=1 Tax=Aphanomyces stellatus TaxID=120398 RepID=A0A485L6K3_9STRA|nr:hypothetical protein As57867_016504 [Aphanomyces stellatus]KAF0692356.1 hypothetical protein As57867_016510 [Aphanomyces stellatus]VFT93334.1 Aste57867_16561 [Aphanomyces stellatus]VFT93340.1 Aste57867_16567 [Aphanomyces stellatus]